MSEPLVGVFQRAESGARPQLLIDKATEREKEKKEEQGRGGGGSDGEGMLRGAPPLALWYCTPLLLYSALAHSVMGH